MSSTGRPRPKAGGNKAFIELLPIVHPIAVSWYGKATVKDMRLIAQSMVLKSMGMFLSQGLTDEDPGGIQ